MHSTAPHIFIFLATPKPKSERQNRMTPCPVPTNAQPADPCPKTKGRANRGIDDNELTKNKREAELVELDVDLRRSEGRVEWRGGEGRRKEDE